MLLMSGVLCMCVLMAGCPHVRTVERVVGIGFQPRLDAAKPIKCASEAGEIQFLDMRNGNHAYLTTDPHTRVHFLFWLFNDILPYCKWLSKTIHQSL
ncbi:unnamed protein product, partial [Vitis vinifera]